MLSNIVWTKSLLDEPTELLETRTQSHPQNNLSANDTAYSTSPLIIMTCIEPYSSRHIYTRRLLVASQKGEATSDYAQAECHTF